MTQPSRPPEELIPDHIQDNYRERVTTEFGGDWTAMAEHFRRDPYAPAHLARWAAAQATGPAAAVTPPRGRRGGGPRETTTA